MLISSFFYEVDVRLVTYEELMAAITYADSRSIELVTIAYDYPMKTASYQARNRISWAIRHTAIEHFLVVRIN